MIAGLRSLWRTIQASYWFYPALFTLAALLLAYGTIWIDRIGVAETLERLGFLAPPSPEGARSLLALIAASMIGIAATIFSITIAAVAYASGTYGPRILTNFMEDRGNQLSLGIFIATFVYSLLLLRVVRSETEQAVSPIAAGAPSVQAFVPQLSLLVVFGLTLVSIAALVFLLNHIPASIRINSVIERIGRRLLSDLDRRFPDPGVREPHRPAFAGQSIFASAPGYIRIVDFDALDRFAKKMGGRIALARRPGDFVHPVVPLLEWDGIALDDEGQRELRNCFAIGGHRTAEQDPDYLIDELVEIALRALSPGINDPFTAITALDWLGAATAELARRNLDDGPEGTGHGSDRILPLPDGFDHYLQRGLGTAMPTVARNDVAAVHFCRILKGLLPAAANPARYKAILEMKDAVLMHAQASLDSATYRRVESLAL